MSRSARFDEQSFSATQSKKARKLRRRKRELDDDEDEDREVLPRWKIIAVFAAIGICFAMLFPSLFAPLLSSMFGWKRGGEPQQTAQPHHPYMQSNGPPRPGGGPSRPMPGRMPQPEIPQSGRGGMFSWMLPIYTVGVMGFLIYTLVKMNRRKKKRRNRYEDDIDEMDVSGSNSEDDDDSDRDGLGHRNLRSIQSRLRETETAMAKILEQLEEIAQAAPNGGFDTAELMANYPPDKLRETERNLQELNRLNELRTKQKREIAELDDVEVEDLDDDQEIEDKHPTYAEVVANKQANEEKSINRPLHEDGTPFSYAEVIAPKPEGTKNNQSTQQVTHKPPVHSDGTPLTFAEVVSDKPIEKPEEDLKSESVVYTYANAADPTIPPSRVFKRAKRKRPYGEGEAKTPSVEDAKKFEEQRQIVESLSSQKPEEQPAIDDSEFPPLVSDVANDETELSNESVDGDHEEVIESPIMDPEEFPPLPHVEQPEDHNDEVQETEEEVTIEDPILSSDEFPPLPPAADPPMLHHEVEETKTEEPILDPEQFPPLSNEETEEGDSTAQSTQKPSQKSKRSNNKNRRQRARREN
ncbi:RIC3 domain-containing protein [Aphelenchoides besseyi]|nr:RIC3 domain-containing protein [Aphelenchoides besseyi]